MAANLTAAHSCPAPMKATSNGFFQGDNPLEFALPLAILQIVLVIVVTRSLAYVLKPLRQPRVIAEILGGVLLGPSSLGRSQSYMKTVFPAKSITVLDTLANIGLLLFLFLVGLELNFKSLLKTGKKALGIAVAGISLPFALGVGVSYILRETIAKGAKETPFLIFMGVALSITAFPVLARILAELKLLTTDVGKLAMSAAAVNDVAAWILLALAIALSGHTAPIVPLWIFLCGLAFVILSVIFAAPVFKWMAGRCAVGEPVPEMFICGTLAAVLAAGFVTDMIGIHAMFGAFVFGVLVPKEGPLANALVEKVEDLVSGLFIPLFFVSSGLKTNVATIKGAQSWGLLVLLIATACFGKIFGTLVVSLCFRMPVTEALALGFLMNSKGLVELIVLNIGKDRKVLNDQTFAIMVLMALFTTFITTPLVMAVYKPAKRSKKGAEYKHRRIERMSTNSELRILACFHSARNIPSIINLFEASRGTEKLENLCVYAMHLMELSERSSAIQMVQKARKNGLPFWNKSKSENIVVAFEAYHQLSKVTVKSMTSISSFTDMHEDIIQTAERKRAAVILVPFHKHQRLDGMLETTRAEYQSVNGKVLELAPCSVGVLVDRGLGGTAQVSASNVSYEIVVPFFGGFDDREALAYGKRMAEHPGINLTVIRFTVDPAVAGGSGVVQIDGEAGRSSGGSLADEEAVSRLDNSVVYVEVAARNSGDVVTAMLSHKGCNLFLVGRNPAGELPLSLVERSDYPELGPVGNLLANFTSASVLVMQQYQEKASSSSTLE